MSPGMGDHKAIAGTKGFGRINYGPAQRPTTPLRVVVPRVLHYLKPYWQRWILIFVCILSGAALNLAPPLLVRQIIDDALPNRDFWLLALAVAGSVLVDLTARLIGVGQFSLNV